MKFFLTVLFLVNGEMTVVSGMLPLEMDSEAECHERLEFLQGYLREDTPYPSTSVTGCIEAEDMFRAAGLLAAQAGEIEL